MSRSLIPAQRRERIQEYLLVHRIARIDDLCALLDASEATVRRDLEWLEAEGVVERTRGGAIINQRLIVEPEYLQRLQRYPEEKRAIGALAASLIGDREIVFINSGTTTAQVLSHIRPNAGISVFTNNLKAILEVGSNGLELYVLGGEYQPVSRSSAGRFAIEQIRHIYADKAIIGVDGISLKHGCTVPTNAEAEVVRRMIEHTKGQIIVVADHSKWGVVSNFQVATVDEIDLLITDERFEPAAVEELAAHAVEVQMATLSPQRSP